MLRFTLYHQKFKALSIFSFLLMMTIGQLSAQTYVGVGPGQTWLGYMNVYDSTGANYLWGSSWGLNDLKTVIDTPSGDLTLKPNYNAYNASDPYWSNGAIGNKVMEAISYVEMTGISNQTVTFQGSISSYTLASGYAVTAFVKALDPAAGYAAVVNQSIPITTAGNFSVSAMIPNTAGLITQYGFTVTGLNANPTTETANGSVNVLGNTFLSLSEVKFSSIQADQGVHLKWEMPDESQVKNYTLQKGSSPEDMVPVYTIAAENSSESNVYKYLDTDQQPGDSYYRLMVTENSGSVSYSQMLHVTNKIQHIGRLYPNPSSENITIDLGSAAQKTTVDMYIYDMHGSLQSARHIENLGGSTCQISTEHLTPGTYILSLQYEDVSIQRVFSKH